MSGLRSGSGPDQSSPFLGPSTFLTTSLLFANPSTITASPCSNAASGPASSKASIAARNSGESGACSTVPPRSPASLSPAYGHDGSHYSVGSSPLFVESVFSVRTRKECVNFHPFSDYWLHSFNRLDIFLGQLFPVVKLVFDVAHFQKLKAKSIGNCIFDDRFSIFVPGNPFSSMFSEADLF